MKYLKFEIVGNQLEKDGNPISYKRTVKGMWREADTTYHEWMDYVRRQFRRQIMDKELEERIVQAWKAGKEVEHPIILEKDEICTMYFEIYYKDKKHGDPDNLFKGVADALFLNDKNVYPIIPPHAAMYTGKQGKIIVSIEIVKLSEL